MGFLSYVGLGASPTASLTEHKSMLRFPLECKKLPEGSDALVRIMLVAGTLNPWCRIAIKANTLGNFSSPRPLKLPEGY
jgi:hypothetical protein